MKGKRERGKASKLYIPALRAQMGSWYYYIAQMRMADVAERVSVASDIHQSKSLNDLIQRRLSERSKDISEYLLSQEQRFFNAFVLGIYGGQPRWYELDVKSNNYLDAEEELPPHVESALGFLTLSGEEKIFAIDGQHRVAGIQRAVKEEPGLGDDEIAAIFVGHKKDDEGVRRTRRLFTTLNKHAKVVNKLDTIALDEDDVVAVVTRYLVENYPLFENKVALVSGNNLPPRDVGSFTTIGTLYDAVDIFLRDRNKTNWNKLKLVRPDDAEIKRYTEQATEFWDALLARQRTLTTFSKSPADPKAAAPFRNAEDGGHLLFRPVGLLLFVRVLRSFVDVGTTLEEALNLLSRIPMALSNDLWTGLLWDTSNQRMLTSTENQRAAEKLLFYLLGGDLSKYRSSEALLKKELAGVLNKPLTDVELPDLLVSR